MEGAGQLAASSHYLTAEALSVLRRYIKMKRMKAVSEKENTPFSFIKRTDKEKKGSAHL